VSALLFQLVQTSAHDVRIHAQKLARKRREAIADAKLSSFVEGSKAPLLDEHDREVRWFNKINLASLTPFKSGNSLVSEWTRVGDQNGQDDCSVLDATVSG
jgi:hypothetical protein